MTVSGIDWFDGVDARLPVALLRHVAESTNDVGSALAAVMEIALRRTAAAGSVEVAPVTAARSRGSARRAQIEPRALPADIGLRSLAVLREVADGHLGSDERDVAGVTAELSEVLAVRLGVPVPVSRVAVAVALSARAVTIRPARPVVRIPRQRELLPTGGPAASATA